MPRFYFDTEFQIGQLLPLPTELAHHIQVLRLQIGAELELFNGHGLSVLAELTELGKKQATVKLLSDSTVSRELAYAITLAQGLPEGSKFDWILEKAVELGVSRIQPLAAQRSVVKLHAERVEKKYQHWQGIIISASEQSGRNQLLTLAPVLTVNNYLQQMHDVVRIMLSPRAELPLCKWLAANPPQALEIMIGPEGGFSAEEEQLAAQQGVLQCAFGPRILRTETAGLAVVSAINAHWGGFA